MILSGNPPAQYSSELLFLTVFSLALLVVIGIAVVIKTAPVLRYIYGFGTSRAYLVALIAHGLSVFIGNKFMLPILNGLKNLH